MNVSKENVLKRSKYITLRIAGYSLAIAASLCLLVFIVYSSKSSQPQFIASVIGAWVLFLAFCLYKMHRVCSYRGVFRKGTLTVSELDAMDGIAFEELACDILLANGFEIAENTPASGDFGVDILAQRDGMTNAIQCKRYAGPVGLEAVQQVYAGRAFYECHVAVVLANQPFTANAQKLADKLGVVLWDRDALSALL
jgi:restriction system protein